MWRLVNKGRKMDMLEQVEIKVDLVRSQNSQNKKKWENWLLKNIAGAYIPHLGRIKRQSISTSARVRNNQLTISLFPPFLSLFELTLNDMVHHRLYHYMFHSSVWAIFNFNIDSYLFFCLVIYL